MPIAPAELLAAVGLSVKGTVIWGDGVPSTSPGVYAISLGDDPTRNSPLLPSAPLSLDAIRRWIAYVPGFQFDRCQRPTAEVVGDFLKQFWLPDESVVYVGKATCLQERLGQFRGHTLGNRSPHAGGHWLKALSNLNELYVHFAECDSADEAESLEGRTLDVFMQQVSARTLQRLCNPELPLPFANAKSSVGKLKQRRLSRCVHR